MGRSDSALKNRMIFLVGARRSGTNWLQRILRSHPHLVAMPTETYLFSHGLQPLSERVQHANPGSLMVSTVFVEREHFLDAVRDLADRVFLDNLERLGPDARYLLERTPEHASHLDFIARVYPDAKVIHIVRDGRAVARSLLSMGWGPQTIEAAAVEWRDTVRKARDGGRSFGTGYREVIYERLLVEPEEGIRDLLAWLELELDGPTWEHIQLEASSEFNVDPASPGVSADKWRHELSPAEVRVVERIGGEQLRAFGYELTSGGLNRLAEVQATVRRRAGKRLDYVRAHWDLRTVARASLTRAYSRYAAHAVADRYRVVELFERLVADGRPDSAVAMCTKNVRIRSFDEGNEFSGRGPSAARALLSKLEQHRLAGLKPLMGDIDMSAEMFTAVLHYELGDGSHWARTMVFDVKYPSIASVAMYRFRVTGHDGHPQAASPRRAPALPATQR